MQFFQTKGFVRIAHRGASGYVPENTLPAFETALTQGTDALHLDTCLTADHCLVVSHDTTVDRTTNGAGRIAEMTLAEVQKLNAGWHSAHVGEEYRDKGLRIPTVADVLALDNGLLGWCFDIKDQRPECVSALVAVLRDHDLVERALVSSASTETITFVREHVPEVSTTLSRLEVVEFYSNLWAAGDRPSPFRPCKGTVLQIPEYAAAPDSNERFYLPTEGAIEAAHECGMPVFVATVDNEDAMASLRRIGVDGIHTDFPDRLSRLLRKEAVAST